MANLMPTEQLSLLQSIAPTPDQVLRVVGLEGLLPVDPLEVSRRLGINCLAVPSKNIAAALGTGARSVEGVSFLHESDNSYWIVYGNDWHENAQRFTVAHELGHVILHKDRLPLNRNRACTQSFETEANRFAASLLMPNALVRRYIGLPPEVVARQFRVSPRAAEIRLSNAL